MGGFQFQFPSGGFNYGHSFVPSQTSYVGLGGSERAETSMFPGLTGELAGFLNSELGQGLQPFDLSTFLPSTGGMSDKGNLTAPLNPTLQSLIDFFSGKGSSIPGSDTLKQLADTGMPVDQTPAWQAMIDSMQRNIGQNQANLKEQFNFAGGLAGSPFAQAMTDFQSQTAKDENAQLLQAQAQALEAARGRQMGASEFITSGAGNLGQMLQGLDQSSIDRIYQEFQRVQPENNPLLNMIYGLGTTFAPIFSKNYGTGASGGLAQSAGSLAGGLGGLISVLAGL
jgi:hypothetical protein